MKTLQKKGNSDVETLIHLRDGYIWGLPPTFQLWIGTETLISVIDNDIQGHTGREGSQNRAASQHLIALFNSPQWTHSLVFFTTFTHRYHSSLSLNSFLYKPSANSFRLYQGQSSYSLSTVFLGSSKSLPHIKNIKDFFHQWGLDFILRVKCTLICFSEK